MCNIEEVCRHALGRVDNDIELGFLAAFFVLFFLLLAGKGDDGYIVSNDDTLDLNALAFDRQIHAAGNQVVDHNLVLLNIIGIQNQTVQ